MIETWLPTLVAAAALGLIWAGFSKKSGDLDNKMEEYLTKKEHEKDCQIATLTLEKHITKTIDKLKNDVFQEIRSLKDLMEND